MTVYCVRRMAHDPSFYPSFLSPETWAENFGRVPSLPNTPFTRSSNH